MTRHFCRPSVSNHFHSEKVDLDPNYHLQCQGVELFDGKLVGVPAGVFGVVGELEGGSGATLDGMGVIGMGVIGTGVIGAGVTGAVVVGAGMEGAPAGGSAGVTDEGVGVLDGASGGPPPNGV
jgi:hypothetical protein